MSRYILAHDLGTTGNKANLFDTENSRSGSLVHSAFAPYDTAYPQPGWAEQTPRDWWRAIVETTRRLRSEANVAADEIAAVSFSGQMMGCVAVDQNGESLRDCIIWADQRATAQAAQIADACGADEVYQRAGHRVSAAYTAAKILWLRDHEPEIFERATSFLQPKDYVALRLTGERATDFSDASGTLLFDLATRDWIDDFLHALDLPREKLPTPHPAATVIGAVAQRAADETGLAPGTPVVIGGGDGACAGVGAGVVEPGAAYCYIGSSAWISVSSRQPVRDASQRVFTFHGLHAERYAPMGTMQAAGGARDWAWRVLNSQNAAGDLDAAAATVAPGSDGLLFLPYLIGERSPHWNPHARGAFVGLSTAHGEAAMARAVLEGVAFNLRLILHALRDSLPDLDITQMRLIGGGSRSDLWPQMLADCFALPIQRLALTGEATSWGAAVAAGVATGLYDWSIAAARTQIASTVEPVAEHVSRYAEVAETFDEAYAALVPIYERLAR